MEADTWQSLRVQVQEIEADTIDQAVIALKRLDGMFEAKSVQDQVTSLVEVLDVQSSNRRRAVDSSRTATESTNGNTGKRPDKKTVQKL